MGQGDILPPRMARKNREEMEKQRATFVAVATRPAKLPQRKAKKYSTHIAKLPVRI